MRALLLAAGFVVLAGGAARARGPGLVPLRGMVRAEVREEFVEGTARVFVDLTVPEATTCSKVATAVDRRGAWIRITIEGLQPGKGTGCLAREPPAARTTIDLSSDVGRHTLTIRSGGRSDDLALEISASTIVIEALAPVPQLATLRASGTLLRAPPHSLWVEIYYDSEEARRNYRPQAASVVRMLEGIGARRSSPAEGRYALPYTAWKALDPHPLAPEVGWPPLAIDHFYFTYDGSFEAVAEVGARFIRYDSPHDRPGAFMSLHIASWHGHYFNTR